MSVRVWVDQLSTVIMWVWTRVGMVQIPPPPSSSSSASASVLASPLRSLGHSGIGPRLLWGGCGQGRVGSVHSVVGVHQWLLMHTVIMCKHSVLLPLCVFPTEGLKAGGSTVLLVSIDELVAKQNLFFTNHPFKKCINKNNNTRKHTHAHTHKPKKTDFKISNQQLRPRKHNLFLQQSIYYDSNLV